MRIPSWPQLIGSGLLSWLLVILQTSFIASLPGWWALVPLSLMVIIFVELIIDLPTAVWMAIIGGMTVEVFSPFTVGSVVVPLLISMVVMNMLFQLLFTNRSLLSLTMLGSVGLLVFHTLQWLWNQATYWLGIQQVQPYWSWSMFVLEWLWLLVGLSLLFVISQSASKRLRSTFLASGRR